MYRRGEKDELATVISDDLEIGGHRRLDNSHWHPIPKSSSVGDRNHSVIGCSKCGSALIVSDSSGIPEAAVTATAACISSFIASRSAR